MGTLKDPCENNDCPVGFECKITDSLMREATCVDINECNYEDAVCGMDDTCKNTEGSYVCIPPPSPTPPEAPMAPTEGTTTTEATTTPEATTTTTTTTTTTPKKRKCRRPRRRGKRESEDGAEED